MNNIDLTNIAKDCVLNSKDIILESFTTYFSSTYISIKSSDNFFNLKLFFQFDKENTIILRLTPHSSNLLYKKETEIWIKNNQIPYLALGYNRYKYSRYSHLFLEEWEKQEDCYVMISQAREVEYIYDNKPNDFESYYLLYNMFDALKPLFEAYGYKIINLHIMENLENSASFIFIPIDKTIKRKKFVEYKIKNMLKLI